MGVVATAIANVVSEMTSQQDRATAQEWIEALKSEILDADLEFRQQRGRKVAEPECQKNSKRSSRRFTVLFPMR